MAEWYNKHGEQIDPIEFQRLRDESPDNWIVGKTMTPQGEISTVLLGLDHSFSDSDGPPIIFETMAFLDSGDEDCVRYATWEEAERGHANYVEKYGGAVDSALCGNCQEVRVSVGDYLCKKCRSSGGAVPSDPASVLPASE